MKKAYDIAELGEKLKSKGLDIAEESAKIVLEATCEWVEESAKLSANPFDDVAIVVLPQVKKFAMEQIDKIDGEKN